MARNYYYLAAGLPDLLIEGNKAAPSMVEGIEELAAQMHPDDAESARLLQAPFDNDNLLAVLEKRDAFDERGRYERGFLEDEVRAPQSLPDYMHVFIEAHRSGNALFPGLSQRDQLNRLFYDALAGHPSEFIRQWFAFDRDLRNVLAALNCRKMGDGGGDDNDVYALRRVIIGGNEVADTLLRSNAPDFSLGQALPWMERVLSVRDREPVDREKAIDQLRWDMLDELTMFSYFGVETLLAFVIKLGIVERWTRLEPEAGRERLRQLTEGLVSGVSISEAFH